MINIYKLLRLYIGYFKFLRSNFNLDFNDYLQSIMNNKCILDCFSDVNNVNVYRLFSVKYFDGYDMATIQPSSFLVRPDGMSQEDVFKIVSYVVRRIVVDNDRFINNLEHVLICKFGFSYVSNVKNRNVVDLFFTNNVRCFIFSKYFDKYFNWISKGNVDFDEIVDIYKKINNLEALKLKM